MTEHRLRVPGDKSITHRALILAALASGASTIRRPLRSADTLSTMTVLRALGAEIVEIEDAGEAAVRVQGTGGRVRTPSGPLDCGNSGTTARLILGVLAGAGVPAIVTGDGSLCRRPVRRVTDPLRTMGARFAARDGDHFPVETLGGDLHGITYASPVASAQVKSAILLAGLVGGVPVEVTEPRPSRDHTERFLEALGQPVTRGPGRVQLGPAVPVGDFRVAVPGDPSSAAFLAGAALLTDRAIRIVDVGINPTRLGFVAVLRRMGAVIDVVERAEAMGEPIGDLVIAPDRLEPVAVLADEIPSLIDEIPLLAVLATRARGWSTFTGVGELRLKESDRLELLRKNLTGLGAEAVVEGDTLRVRGDGPRVVSGRIDTGGDHRMAMAFSVLQVATGNEIALSEANSPDISFPGFASALASVASP